MNSSLKPFALATFFAIAPAFAPALVAAEKSPPKFQEVLELIRANLGGMTPAEIENTAVKALLKQLDGRVVIEDKPLAPTPPPAGPSLSKSARFEEVYGYLRISHVGPDLPSALAAEFVKLGGVAKLKGLLLDLRYAGGADQKAAALTAAQFLAAEGPLLTVAGETLRSSARTNAIQLPITILVNHQTSGAAEVLAALLRQHQVGLLIGTATTGGLRQFKEFTLTTGQRLRIATGEAKLGDGQPLPSAGLRPDIALTVSPDEERGFYAEPYKTAQPAVRTAVSKGETNAAPVRINEAELLRRQRAGEDSEAGEPPAAPTPTRPAVRDPAIARGLDLLKAVNLVRPSKQP